MTPLLVICFLFIVVSIGVVYMVLRKNSRPIPQGALQWMVTGMCTVLVCLSGLVIALIWIYEEPTDLSDTPTLAESFEFQLVSNQENKNLRDYSGKVILLNFWATWCQPCITELPELDELQVAYREKGLVVLTVSDEELEELQLYSDLLPQETVSGFVRHESLPESFRYELANGRPVTYVIDGDGMIREHVRGAGNFAYFEGLVTPWLAELES
ncbi:MAG: TlpA disulfide reductase family protein [Bacteroidetes bacterium]|nr:TlpA disulfide reductase family protein [Bacteroidota bacterium]MCY4205986.1 TlpA disulfide reductase family protein [Bacteroidota bacterium]